jgi:hypothetical protein
MRTSATRLSLTNDPNRQNDMETAAGLSEETSRSQG